MAAMAAEHLGVTRSRTLLFLSYRDSVARDRGKPFYGDRHKTGAYFDVSGELRDHGDGLDVPRPDRHAIGSASSPDISVRLPPRWVDISDEVDAILLSLQPKMAHLDRLHAKHILPGFTDRTEEERDIERETVEITKQFRKCSKLIASLASHTQALARSGHVSAREVAMANNVQTALAGKVQDASGTFRRKQSNYMQRLRGHEERHHDLSAHGPPGSASSVTTTYLPDSETAMREDVELSRQHLESSRSHPLQSQLLLDEDEQASGLAHAEINITQRDREIDQIAKSIAELAELFQDLSALVIDQGTMLDRIDFNIEHMGEDMNAAVRELSGATRYQKRTSRGQCILFLILLILLCLAVIIVKPFWRLISGHRSK